jgi:hypothetical protein
MIFDTVKWIWEKSYRIFRGSVIARGYIKEREFSRWTKVHYVPRGLFPLVSLEIFREKL